MKAIILVTIFFWGDVPSKSIKITTESIVCSQGLMISHTKSIKQMLSSGIFKYPWKAIKSECIAPYGI